MKNIPYLLFSLMLTLGLLFSNACYFDNLQELHPELLLNNDCDTTATISYQTDIQPILSNSCGANNSCHNAQSSSGGVILDSYGKVISVVNNGKFLSSILWDGNASQMPKSSPSKLSECAITKIQKWINAGAPNN
jgi:hypothetical protein